MKKQNRWMRVAIGAVLVGLIVGSFMQSAYGMDDQKNDMGLVTSAANLFSSVVGLRNNPITAKAEDKDVLGALLKPAIGIVGLVGAFALIKKMMAAKNGQAGDIEAQLVNGVANFANGMLGNAIKSFGPAIEKTVVQQIFGDMPMMQPAVDKDAVVF